MSRKNASPAVKTMLVFAFIAMAIAVPSFAAAQSGDARCKIVASGNETKTSLNAQISASGTMTGVYVLEVTSPADGKRLAFRQAEFDIEGKDAVKVLDEEIEVPSGVGYSASLLVEWPGGSSSCSAAGF